MDPTIPILLFSFVTLLALGVPIAVCIASATLLSVFAIGDLPTAYIAAQRMTLGIASFPLLAVPFFILAGELMGRGGMASRLMDFAGTVVGRFRGGLSYVNTITCMLFGSVSGSSAAAVSSVGGFMIPEMERKGYGKEFSVALTTTSATTGLLIPPSNIMIVFAVVAGNVSVAALFMAGVLPGMTMGGAILLASYLLNRRRPISAGQAASIASIGRSLTRALPSMLLIVIVLGGILGGIFSATEASAIAAAYALFLGLLVHRELSWKDLPEIILVSAKKTAVIMLLIGASQALSWVLSLEQIPLAVSEALLGLSTGKIGTLLLINGLLLIVGTFLDMTPAILIFTPILLPVAAQLGLSSVHFGILMIANLCIGLCTPPVGTCLFLGCSVGEAKIAEVVKPLVPIFVLMVVALLLITFLPSLSLWLPAAVGV